MTILILLCNMALNPSTAAAKRVELQQVNVLADSSLIVPLSLIARQYSQSRNAVVNLSFTITREQALRTMQGMEADLFISTRESVIQSLQNQGLIDVYSDTPIARGRLVLATQADNTLSLTLIRGVPLRNLLAMPEEDFSLILHDPEYQAAGYFAMEALRHYGLDGELEPHFLFLQTPMDVQKLLETRGYYGVVLKSEVVGNPLLRIIDTFPENAHAPIMYRAVVVAGNNMDGARAFLDYLTKPEAQAILIAHGLEAP